jgi:hypothetical protein
MRGAMRNTFSDGSSERSLSVIDVANSPNVNMRLCAFISRIRSEGVEAYDSTKGVEVDAELIYGMDASLDRIQSRGSVDYGFWKRL